jgi:GNAT superfamily N-acetyltransferase
MARLVARWRSSPYAAMTSKRPSGSSPHQTACVPILVRTEMSWFVRLSLCLAPRRGCWEQVVELQVTSRDERFEEEIHRIFRRRRLHDLRTLFRAERDAWYVALDGGDGEVLGSCGVVVTGAATLQSVETAPAYRRQGICSRLVVEAAHRSAEEHGARRFVIAADPGYHALGLY